MSDRVIFKRVLVMFCVLSVSCVVWAGIASAYSTTYPTPTLLPGGRVVTAREAKTLLDTKAALFFDVRSVRSFSAGHLVGATHLPYVQQSADTATFDASLDTFNLAGLPVIKTTQIVFYSNSFGGWKSYKASIRAIAQGYTNVRWLRGGIADWKAAQYPIQISVGGL